MPTREKEEGEKGNSYRDSTAHDRKDPSAEWLGKRKEFFDTRKDDWFAPIDL
jgi:hypothetical protein